MILSRKELVQMVRANAISDETVEELYGRDALNSVYDHLHREYHGLEAA